MSNVGQIQANLRKNAAEMSFVILEMSFGVWEMSFTHFWEMSFTRNAQKKSLYSKQLFKIINFKFWARGWISWSFPWSTFHLIFGDTVRLTISKSLF